MLDQSEALGNHLHELNLELGFSIQDYAVQLQEPASLLPAQWVGSQAYQLKAKVKL